MPHLPLPPDAPRETPGPGCQPLVPPQPDYRVILPRSDRVRRHLRADDTSLRIDDLQLASDACQRFAHRAWPRGIDAFARRLNPALATISDAGFGAYHWVVDQAGIATDVMFADRAALAAVLPDLIRHASLSMSSADVVQFLGRKLHPSLKAQVITDTKCRPESWRVKHRLAWNWIKVYDKVSVLRVEACLASRDAAGPREAARKCHAAA